MAAAHTEMHAENELAQQIRTVFWISAGLLSRLSAKCARSFVQAIRSALLFHYDFELGARSSTCSYCTYDKLAFAAEAEALQRNSFSLLLSH